MRFSWSLSICLGVLGVAIAAPASAQAVAVAESLFDRGLADMLAGRYDTGCPALAESQRLDPRPGRLFTLAECEAKWGRIATAVARYNDYLAMVDRMSEAERVMQSARRKLAHEQRRALAPLVPRLTLSLPPDAPAGTRVQRDGMTLEQPSLGVALPVDPGEHVVTTQAPGGPVTEKRLTIGRSESRVIVLEVTPSAPEEPPPAEQPPSPARLPSVAPLAAPSPGAGANAPDQGPSGRRVVTYVAGGVGVAGLVVGSVTGWMALDESGVAAENCRDVSPGNARCNPAGIAAGNRAKQLGLVSTVSFGAGVALAGAAALVLLLEPAPRRQPAPAVSWELTGGQAGGGVVMHGRW
ncbi:hypothetical protein SOCE26_061130 [Sorangium cellulosum]|uniref:PEGA domain-containing protein n=1 Tax=Sorangium cellulosum TaxID=56 RepID=A0A2L0EZA6_SORCE|nr:hypothetical protein [Sorangium cellulosum]AUX44647.1 hypothetical protein SOCE26_061130 [Sorangium cellulosum]